MSRFAHLHLHTQYSLLDGLNKLDEVVAKAASLGQPGIAITDHGNMHGAIEFYDKARSAGIKPILGCELYVAPGSRFEKKTKQQGSTGAYHLTALASNYEGYQNLCRLITRAYREGFYFKPRVDHELLKEYSKGLIILSGCLAGEAGQSALKGDEDRFKETIDFYASTFGDRYYLEVQPHPISEQQRLNEFCATYAKSKGIPLVATTDCHYLNEDDHYAQEVLMCISTGKQITDPDRIRHEGVSLFLKDESDMLSELSAFSYADEAVKMSGEIAERCNVEFDFSTHYMPQFREEEDESENVPAHSDDWADERMRADAEAGLAKRLEEFAAIGKTVEGELLQVYRDRLEEEIELIKKMGFPGYFLVVADFIVWAKRNNIPVGPGRGSAAGSLVAFCLYITDIDPIEHKLLFERFLNPERVSLPDIDVDFCIRGRDAVIKYVVEKYGKENVAQIATFGTLKAKAAIKDVGRALGYSYAETDRVAQLVPSPRQGFDFTLEEALKMEPRLKEYAEKEGQDFMRLAMRVEGLTRHTSTHAAGVVIGDQPLDNLLPMMVDKDGNDVTQFSMKYVEKIGLVKFDFLGLKTLTVIQRALDFIHAGEDSDFDLRAVPQDDSQTFEMLCRGNTTGVFQLESSGITEMTKRLRPACFDDLVAILALYRPGPLDSGMADRYIERKNGREETSYIHPMMEPILRDTYGIILYQEQIMQLARELASYSLAEADLLRRAMGKKIPEEMAKQKDRFLDGAIAKDISKADAEEIFSQMETFARYGFNRSHSAAYALISFQTAYLKSHYPVEFMAALMTLELGDSEKTLKNLSECRAQKIEVLPPDVNYSFSGFRVSEGRIRYGLSAVKGVGEKAVEVILAEREANGTFEDLEDFCERIDFRSVNRRVMESLVKCGAFDHAPQSRRELLERLEELIRSGQRIQEERGSNQVGLFASKSGEPEKIVRRTLDIPEWPVNKKLAFEREALGFYISGHPLAKYERLLKQMGSISTQRVKSVENKKQVTVGGVITTLRLKNTKKGDRYATFVLEDVLGNLESIVWPDTYRQVYQLLASEEPVFVKGRADVNEDRATLIVESIQALLDYRQENAKNGLISFSSFDDLESKLMPLGDLLKKFPGACPLTARVELETEQVQIALRDEDARPISVEPSEELCDQVEELFGRPVLFFT